MAGDLLGCPGSVEILLNIEEDAISSGYPIAQALSLKPCTVLSHAETRECGGDMIDLAVWLHPANESLEVAEVENRTTALRLVNSGVPTFATTINEVDLLGQNYLLNADAIELQPLGGESWLVAVERLIDLAFQPPAWEWKVAGARFSPESHRRRLGLIPKMFSE
jgi:hypothetical protein